MPAPCNILTGLELGRPSARPPPALTICLMRQRASCLTARASRTCPPGTDYSSGSSDCEQIGARLAHDLERSGNGTCATCLGRARLTGRSAIAGP